MTKERKAEAKEMYYKMNSILCGLNDVIDEMKERGLIEETFLGDSVGAKNWTHYIEASCELEKIQSELYHIFKA